MSKKIEIVFEEAILTPYGITVEDLAIDMLTDGLISYWDLDDLTDKHGSNDMTNNNGVTFVSDGGITVADFESLSFQSLSRADADVSGFTGLTEITIAAFQKIEKLPNNAGDKNSWGVLSKFFLHCQYRRNYHLQKQQSRC